MRFLGANFCWRNWRVVDFREDAPHFQLLTLGGILTPPQPLQILRPATWFFRKRVGVLGWYCLLIFWNSSYPVFGRIYFKKKLWYSFYDWHWFMGSSDIHDVNSCVVAFFNVLSIWWQCRLSTPLCSWAARWELISTARSTPSWECAGIRWGAHGCNVYQNLHHGPKSVGLYILMK